MNPTNCPDCGRPLPAGAPAGLCAACLLKLGEQSEVADDPSTLIEKVLLTEETGALVGRYKLLEKLGEGGFGAVWAAEQREPVKRRVALKIIKLGMDTKQVVARFEAERQALALMDHPNIAKVLDAGTTDNGRPFFVMELVKGIPITKYCEHERLGTQDRLDLFIKVCHAIQHAHQKGIIHRDIKPSNILVTLHDGVPVPKVIDFGIAKATQQELTELTIYTQHHQFIGTPAYMSPEQAEMSGLDIDTRSDIYSLGVLLYELLTGKTPFDAKELMQSGIDEMRRIIREQEPVRPSTRLSQTLAASEVGRVAPRAPGKGESLSTSGAHGVTRPTNEELRTSSRRLLQELKGDLDWIVMKCLEKDRSRRYDTANGLAADLKRHLSNEPVVARPPSAAYRLQKTWRRHRVLMTAGFLVAFSLSFGIGFSLNQARRARTAEREQKAAAEQARADRNAAVAAQEREAQLLYTSDMGRAQQAWDDSNVGLVLELLNRHRDRKRPGDFEWYYLWRLCQRGVATPAITNDSPAMAVALSPDGRLLVSGGMDGQVSLINPATRQRRKLGSHESKVLCAAISRDGQLLATGSGDRTVKLWDLRMGREKHQITDFTDWVTSTAFSPDGKLLAIGSYDGRVSIWNVVEKKFEWRAADGLYVNDVSFSPDGGIVGSVSDGLAGGEVPPGMRLRDAVTGRVLHERTTSEMTAHLIRFSPNGDHVATAGQDGTIRIWDRELKDARVQKGRAHAIRSMVHLDNETLATGGSDNTVRLWSTTTGELSDTLKGHSGAVRGVACSSDGRMLVSASMDHTVKLWQVDGANERSELHGHLDEVKSVAVSPDSLTIGSGGQDGTAMLWDAITGDLKFPLVGHTKGLNCIAFSADGKTLATGGDDTEIILWDTATGKEVSRLSGHTETVWSLAFLNDNLTLASTGEDRTVRLWSVTSGASRVLHTAGSKLGCLAVWQDRLLAFGSWDDNDIEVWDLRSGERGRPLTGHLGAVRAVAFTRTGDKLLTGSWDTTVRSWDLPSPAGSEILARHTDTVYALALAPDGSTLASGGTDGAIKLLDLNTRKERATLKGHVGTIWSMAFSSDGKLLVSGGADRVVRLWRAATDEEVTAVTDFPTPVR